MPAPIAQLDIEQQIGGEIWTNRYLTSVAPNDPTSGALIDALIAAHRPILLTIGKINRVRHATLTPGDEDYHIEMSGLAGTRTYGAGTELPLFCIARVDFTTGAGRPSRKYLRGFGMETDMTSAAWVSAALTVLNDTYVPAILALDEIVDPQGDTLLSGQAHPAVGMRQLRRGTRRRTEPVL